MKSNIEKKTLKLKGMTCSSCEARIEKSLKKMEGIIEIKAVFHESKAYIDYDTDKIKLNQIIKNIENLGYQVNDEEEKNMSGLIGIGIIIFAIYLIIKNTIGFNFIPQVSPNMGYGILFVVGLLTSLHCIAMCGGINLSQCSTYKFSTKSSKFSKLKPSIMYNGGRVISYTIIGGIVGAIGSVVSFSGWAKGIIAIVAGVFMVIMGLNMLNVFPWLRRLNPRMPKIFSDKIHKNNSKHGPFYIGLMNGLMPCGPLQSMQLYALGTGSFIAGAFSMFMFSLGTLPLMFGFGALATILSGKYMRKMMRVSAVLVVILGVIMVSRGLNLSGVSTSFATDSESGSIAKIDGNIQIVNTTLDSGQYSPIMVQGGIPVKWTITAKESDLNGCNDTITIPKYNIEKKLVPGENIIEFTPEGEGNIPYTCWMGMISSNIKIVPDITRVSEKDVQGLESENGIGGGGCCAAGSQATKFTGGKIPTDNIAIAQITNDTQEVSIDVSDEGYSPAVVILQKNVKAKIRFNPIKLNSCNNVVVFPEYQGQLNLQNGEMETPYITPDSDFTFQCWMGMLHGYVKVVDDINNINIDEIKKEVESYATQEISSGSGGGCCGV